jgi:methyl-accepting chemotaxis protein
MPSENKKNYRKKILIDPLQTRFALYSLLIFSIAVAGIWLEFVGAFKNIRELIVATDPVSPVLIPLKNASAFLSRMILLKLGLLMGGIWLAAIVISHRIVGPLYRLRECLKKVGAGDFSTRMNLRKGDAFQDIAKLFNEMMETLNRKIKP